MVTKGAKNEVEVREPEAVSYTDTWDDVVATADVIVGADLAKDDILDALEGVPFVITRVTFRPAASGRPYYVSCEATIAPKHELERKRVDLTSLPFDALDSIVFNDGGTGVYRQIVAYLHEKGFIVLPEPIVQTGKLGDTSYDLPITEWADVNAGDMRFDANGNQIYTVNIRLLAKRGLRVSEYQNEFTKDGKTRYFA